MYSGAVTKHVLVYILLLANSNPPDHITISYDKISLDYLDKALTVEYELHNTDTSARRISLYAGAGTIAWLKNQSANHA